MLTLLAELWTRIQPRLRASVGEAAHRSWLEELRPIAMERSIFYLEGRNRMVCERVQRLFQPLLEEHLSRELGTKVSVQLIAAAESMVDRTEVGPANPVVDASNDSAFMLLKALILDKPLPARLFFLHGPPGCGKTFLLRWWIDHAAVQPRVYEGTQLLKAFQACLRDGRLADLRAELCVDRPLAIDEVHRFSGHARIQRELLAALTARGEGSPPVVLTSRWHPQEIWRLDRELQALLVSGFVTRVDLPGPRARLQYLRALEGAASRNGRAENIEELARAVRGGFPELRRAWAMQRQAAAGRRPGYLQLITPSAVFQRNLERIAASFEVAADQLVGKGQGRRVSFARQVLSYLCVQEGLSRAEVGRYLGGRSRAAISYSIKALEKRMTDSGDVRARVEGLL